MSSTRAPETSTETVKFEAPVRVESTHRVAFTRNAFSADNSTLEDLYRETGANFPAKTLVVIDTGLEEHWPDLESDVRSYLSERDSVFSPPAFVRIPGGEESKGDTLSLKKILNAIDEEGICRHSYVLAIGGGAVLDVAGFAATVAHRGVRLIRFPTTTLAQGDSGVGVKNGANRFGKKNFIGTFAVPSGIVNDEVYLTTLSEEDWRCGFSEAVKVAAIKDREYFEEIVRGAEAIVARDLAVAFPILQRSAELHFLHIVEGGDPFEQTVARPLDFGHWSAHKMEQMTDFELRHGEAVAIGVALDTTYSELAGFLPPEGAAAVRDCLKNLGFDLYHPCMENTDTLFEGIEEFRQHLGGEMALTLLNDLGEGFTARSVDLSIMRDAIGLLCSERS